MLITLMTVSKQSSDVLDKRKLTVPDSPLCQYNDITLAIYNTYPTLNEEDYTLYFLLAPGFYVQLTDYISCFTLLEANVKCVLFLLLNDCEEDWSDNINYLLYLDRKAIRKKEERERDIYDIKIKRPGDPPEIEDTSEIALNLQCPLVRMDEDILNYAVNKIGIANDICGKDVAEKRRIIEILIKGWPKKKQEIGVYEEVVIERKSDDKKKDKKGKGKKGKKDKGGGKGKGKGKKK